MNRRVLLALAVVILYAGALLASRAWARGWDWNDVPGSLKRLETSKDPGIVRQREEVQKGPEDLKKERALARAAGLPLTTEEWPVKPIPPADDATPFYNKAFALEEEKGLIMSEGAWELLEAARKGRRLSAAEITTLRQESNRRRAVLDLLRQGAARPAIALPAPEAAESGINILRPEVMGRQRTVATALRDEAGILALEGRYAEAARTQALGYNVARQIYRQPVLIAYAVGAAIEAITDAGLETVLQRAGPDEAAARAVLDALKKAPEGPFLPAAFRGEAWFATDYSVSIRKEGPGTYAIVFLDRDKPARARRLTKGEQALLSDLQDAMDADWLRRLRGLVVAAEKPWPQSEAEMQRLVPEASGTINPITAWSALAIQSMVPMPASEARRVARHRVVRAAALVLSHRARTGAWPQRLDEAAPPPVDPFSGKPMGYRREGDGFVVWSVGKEGTFDGGKPGAAREGAIAFRYPAGP